MKPRALRPAAVVFVFLGACSASSSSGEEPGDGSFDADASAADVVEEQPEASDAPAADVAFDATDATDAVDATDADASDPHEADRVACVAKINELRATKGLSPYARWTSAERCVDRQATHDEALNVPHDAYKTGSPSCGGSGQNECLVGGAASLDDCIALMWEEGAQPGCAGCDACDTTTIFAGSCPNCTFAGATVCGHYVNLTSKSFAKAACGFSDLGAWSAIDFE